MFCPSGALVVSISALPKPRLNVGRQKAEGCESLAQGISTPRFSEYDSLHVIRKFHFV